MHPVPPLVTQLDMVHRESLKLLPCHLENASLMSFTSLVAGTLSELPSPYPLVIVTLRPTPPVTLASEECVHDITERVGH